jgi:hypothetical protein
MNSQAQAEELMAHTTFGFALTMSLATVGLVSVVTWLTFLCGWPAVGGIVALALVMVLIQGPPSGFSARPSHRRAYVPFIWVARILFFAAAMVSGGLLARFGGTAGWAFFAVTQILVFPLLVLFAYKLRSSLFVAACLEGS